MRLTGLGFKAALFYLLLLCAFFAAPYANLFFLLLTFLTLLGASSLWSTSRNLEGVSGLVKPVEPAPAGAGVPFRAEVSGGAKTRFAVSIELRLELGETVAEHLGVVRGAVAVTGHFPALPRGLYRLRQAALVSTWPLGLFSRRNKIPAPEEVIVYPTPAELATTRDGGGGVGELYDALGAADGFLQPSNLREYRPGDELRLVHWKASARRSELVIKEWEGGTGSGHEVLLDRRTEPHRLERALSVVSALALAAKEQKELLTVHSQGLSATYGTDREPWRDLYRFLACATPVENEAPPPVSPSVLRLGGAA